jgi:hypothetical protein
MHALADLPSTFLRLRLIDKYRVPSDYDFGFPLAGEYLESRLI